MQGRISFMGLLLIISLAGCGTRKLDPELVGHWYASSTPLTVREETAFMEFEFTKDTADFELWIDPEFQIEGRIGNATIAGGRVHCNWLFPTDMTGISYLIKLDLKGAIFKDDPLPHKEVELWLGPDFDGGEWELRYTEGMAQFPMAFPVFHRRPFSE